MSVCGCPANVALDDGERRVGGGCYFSLDFGGDNFPSVDVGAGFGLGVDGADSESMELDSESMEGASVDNVPWYRRWRRSRDLRS